MKSVMNYIRKDEWSPYVAGILLGLVGIGAVWFSNHKLGASGAFENLAGMIGKATAPKAFDTTYFNFIMPAGISWGLILLVGVFFGRMIGAATSGTLMWGKKGSANSDSQWKRIFGPQVWKRWILAFLGAIILEYAAGIAGGCTSGLALAGGVQLSPAAFLFIPGIFLSGAITALIMYGKKY